MSVYPDPAVRVTVPPVPTDDPSHDSRSDADLVAAANAGEAGAFEALYRRYRDRVARLAGRLVGDDSDAADVAQEAFLYWLGKFPGFELRASVMTFLYPAVKHLAVAARKRRPAGDPAATLATQPARESGGGSGGAGEDVRVLVNHLPEGQREVLLLRFVDDFSLEEISIALVVPLGTVKSRLHHAVATLRADPRVRRYFGKG